MIKKIRKFRSISPEKLISAKIALCSEESIRCRHLSVFRDLAKKSLGLFIAMPANELKKGFRGLAKAQILVSIKGVVAVLACSHRDLKRLASGEFGQAEVIGDIYLRNHRVISASRPLTQEIKVFQTNLAVDRQFMEQARQLESESNCWWRPTACVFVKDNKIVIGAVSFNPRQTNCHSLSIKSSDIQLAPSERISFCNAIHAEVAGIARAAKKGILLEGSCLYVTCCPCEECAKVVAQSGIVRVVFDSEYYDRTGLGLLKENGLEVVKIRNDKS